MLHPVQDRDTTSTYLGTAIQTFSPGHGTALGMASSGEGQGLWAEKIIVNHGNCFIKEGFFLLQGKVGKKSEMGKKGQAINGAGSNSAI